jgi:hypothetical protein
MGKDSFSTRENRLSSLVFKRGAEDMMLKEISVEQGLTKEETDHSLQKIDDQLNHMSQLLLENIKKQKQ